tara:strand:- start:48 stop:1109 length:1062 start_codon:yes stop_codon:yes gene_type:complete
MDLNNLTLFFVIFFFSLFFFKYFALVLKKYRPKILIDNQLSKPQAFHQSPTSVIGGLGFLFSFLIIYLYYGFFKNIFFLEYLTFCTLIFFIGFIDDLKINIKATTRLASMIVVLISLIKYNSFYVESTGIEILNNWIANSEIFSLIFICLCFLFIINGANLIDGYNGLLGIHSLIIFLNLFLVNFFNENYDLANFLFFEIIILVVFLKYNFPKAKIFLGDGGAYFLGSFIAISAIQTSIANPGISPFYFCILLFYLFFEVFFSFLRKLIKEKTSPVHPDKKHLHMLLYKILIKKYNSKLKSNYYVSLIINTIFFLLTIPAIFMMKDGMFCKYYSVLFFVTYIFSYKIALTKIK